MLSLIIKQVAESKRTFAGERGVSVLEYVGITAAAAALAGVIIFYLRGEGLRTIGRAAAGVIDNIIAGFRAVDNTR